MMTFPLRVLIIFLFKLKIFKKEWVLKTKTFFGEDINVVLPELVSSVIFINSHFEQDVEIMMQKYLKKNQCFVDVGAHIGYFSLFASLLVSKKGQVYSFEPTPSTFKILKKNCKRKKNITLFNKGVYSCNKEAFFKDFGIRYSAFNTINEDRIGKSVKSKKIKIKLISLDKFFKNRKIDFIKIDAENSEYEIIKGAKSIIEKDRPILCLELKSTKQKEKEKRKGICNYLKKMKYKAVVFNNDTLVKEKDWDKLTIYENVLFIPNRLK